MIYLSLRQLKASLIVCLFDSLFAQQHARFSTSHLPLQYFGVPLHLKLYYCCVSVLSLFVHTGFFANRSCQDVDVLVHSIDLYVEL